MTTGNIVIVTAGPHALRDVGPDGLDSGESLEARHNGLKLWRRNWGEITKLMRKSERVERRENGGGVPAKLYKVGCFLE